MRDADFVSISSTDPVPRVWNSANTFAVVVTPPLSEVSRCVISYILVLRVITFLNRQYLPCSTVRKCQGMEVGDGGRLNGLV